MADVGYRCGLSGKLHIAAAWTGREERVDDGYSSFWYSHSPGEGIGRGNDYAEWVRQQGVDIKTLFTTYREYDDSYREYKPSIDERYHQTTWCFDRAIDFIQAADDKPWLMSVNTYDPHKPFDAPAKYRDKYFDRDLPKPVLADDEREHQQRLEAFFHQGSFEIPDEKEHRERVASYYGMVEMIDKNIGRVLDELERTGQRDNTIIIFHSDHGEMLGDHGLVGKGCRFYEGVSHVPLIISWPHHFKENLKSTALVELTDIVPTLAEIAGVKLEWTHGKSLVPILTGQAAPAKHRDFVRCEYYDTLNPHFPDEVKKHRPSHATMYRDERYKLCVYHGSDYGELFDMEKDPHELHNLWEDPQSQAIKHALIKRSFDASIVITDPGPRQIGRY